MGHYYADLMCDDCGNVRCVCQQQGQGQKPNNWILDDDYLPIQVCDFDHKYRIKKTRYGDVDGMPAVRRLGRVEFKTRSECAQHGRDMINKRILELQQEVKELKRGLKTYT